MLGGWTLLALGWSILWFLVATAFVPLKVQDDFALKDVNIGRPAEFLFVTAFGLIAAIAEEVLYRGGLQRLVLRANGKPALAIAVSTITWSLAHSGYTEPHGVKELQMVVLGVVFGVVCHRHGLRAAIVVHAANNLMAMGLGAVL
jgi:membrane protease YdiL (CAAX protease family)